MTAWSILVDNSTAPAESIAWVHLNNQAGGVSGTIIVGGIRTADKALALSANIFYALSANIISPRLSADKMIVLSANINQKLTASICL